MLNLIHWGVKQAFLKAGFQWELRRSGDLELGLWKIPLSKRLKKADLAFPKRFVLIPGLGDTSLSWLTVLLLLQPALRKKYDELVLLDFPGFRGFLSKSKCAPSLDALLTATQDLFDSLRPDTLMGHSLGGWLASSYAIECGQGLRRPKIKHPTYQGPSSLILSSPSGIYESPDAWKKLKGLFDDASSGKTTLRPYLFAKEPKWLKHLGVDFSDFLTRKDVALFISSFRQEHSLEQKLKAIRA